MSKLKKIKFYLDELEYAYGLDETERLVLYSCEKYNVSCITMLTVDELLDILKNEVDYLQDEL